MTWAPLWLSFKIALIATLFTSIAGTGLALLLDWKKLPARHLVDALVSAPLVLPPTVLGYYLLTLLGKTSPLGEAWEAVFGSPIVFTLTGAIIAASVGSLPLVVRAVRVGLEAVDPNVVNAARTLGARPLRVLVTVTLPLAAPGIVAGAMMGFARALGDYGATQMMIGSNIDGVQPASIYVMDQLTGFHKENVVAMSAMMTVLGVTMLYLANRLTRRMHRRA